MNEYIYHQRYVHVVHSTVGYFLVDWGLVHGMFGYFLVGWDLVHSTFCYFVLAMAGA